MGINLRIQQHSKAATLLRVLLFWGIFLLVVFTCGALFMQHLPVQWKQWLNAAAGMLAATAATWCLLNIEKKGFSDIGLVWQSKTLTRFFTGILTGTGLFALLMLSLPAFTELRLTIAATPFPIGAVIGYLVIIPLALMEEMAFRSYPFVRLNKAFGWRFGQVVVALAFALYHIVIGWDPMVALLGPGIWAFVFGAGAQFSGGIALPTGIHVALNTCQPLLGMGGADKASVFTLSYKEGTPAAVMAYTDTVGIAIHLILLVLTLAFIYYYERGLRKKERTS
jgi:uncharacterized protein